MRSSFTSYREFILIPNSAFVDPLNPTIPEGEAWLAINAVNFFPNTFFYAVGSGTSSNPDIIWATDSSYNYYNVDELSTGGSASPNILTSLIVNSEQPPLLQLALNPIAIANNGHATITNVAWEVREDNSVGAVIASFNGSPKDLALGASGGLVTGGTYESPEINISYCNDIWITYTATDSLANTVSEAFTIPSFGTISWTFDTTAVTLNVQAVATANLEWDFGDGNTSTLSSTSHTYVDGLPSHTVTLTGCGISLINLHTESVTRVDSFSKMANTLTALTLTNNSISVIDISQNRVLVSALIDNNLLTELDTSGLEKLETLRVNDNSLSLLDVTTMPVLQVLRCQNNNITVLNTTGLGFLTELQCNANNLAILDIAPLTALQTLACSNNNLSVLDVSNSTNLTNLSCHVNNIKVLDVSKLTLLTNLQCNNNVIEVLDVSNLTALTNLRAESNNISVLDVSNLTLLNVLQCQNNNNIAVLDVTNLTLLTNLQCNNNNISVLDVSGLTLLTLLRCQNNNIAVLNVTNLTALTTLWCQNNNAIATLDIGLITNLSSLRCGNNAIASLNVLNLSTLDEIRFENNSMTTANVDQIFADLVAVPMVNNNGLLQTGGTNGGLTGGTSNADYVTLTGNGWTIIGV